MAGFALCLHADNPLLGAYALKGASDLFVHSFLVGVAALCVVVFVSAHDKEQRRWSIGVGLLASVAGVLCALMLLVLPAQVSAAGAGLLLGFGLTCLLRQWCRYYRLFSYQGALLNTMLAFLAASCWRFAMSHAATPFLFCIGMLVLVSCGALPLLARQIVSADEIKMGLRGAAVAGPSETMGEVMRKGWAAVAGLMLNFFTAGLKMRSGGIGVVAQGGAFKLLAYLLLAVVVWWIVAHARRATGGVLQAFYHGGLPVAAALMLAYPLASAHLAPSDAIPLSTLSFLGAALVNVLGLVVLLWMAKSSDVGFSKAFASFCASCAASVAVGMAAFRLCGPYALPLWSVVLSAYLVAMVAGEAYEAARRLRRIPAEPCETRPEDEPTDPAE